MYKRKTRTEYQIQCDYGYGHGYEEVFTTDSYADARKIRRDYERNDLSAFAVRIIQKRVRIDA